VKATTSVRDGRVDPEVFAGARSEVERAEESPPDVEIEVSFSAERVRHVERPRVRTRVHGEPEAETLDETARENLPERVEPGRIYSKVRGRRTLGGRVRDDGA
jgi:hypothetical protein